MAVTGGAPPWAPQYVQEADVPMVTARRRRRRSIGFRLLLPIAVATIGVGVLGGVQTSSAMDEAREAESSGAVAQALTATVKLNHQLEQELSETEALLQRGGKAGELLLTAQRRRTDEALARYRATVPVAVQAAPEIRGLVDDADAALAELPRMRESAQFPPEGQPAAKTSPETVYDPLTHAMFAVGEALAAAPTDARLNALTETVAALNAVEHHAAEQRGLLRTVFARGRFEHGELAELGELHGAEAERVAQFERVSGPQLTARYREVVRGADVDRARTLLEGALTADSTPAGLRVDPDAWFIAKSNALRRLYLFELEVIGSLEAEATRQHAAAERDALTSGGASVLVIVVSLGIAVLLSVRTSRGLRRLSRSAMDIASGELPTAIAEVSSAPGVETVRRLVRASNEQAEKALAGPNDEIGEVGAALANLHQQALRLAADQAMLRHDISQMFVNLSRRGQTLVQRQLHLIDEFERGETDPQSLAKLFALDHLAARMRRNEENLLVLAGGEPGRRFVNAELLVDVVHAAAAEIDQYPRVETNSIADLCVVAHAVGDVVHLLAELLENATDFSPPNSRVLVTTRRGVDGLTINIFDAGIGMPPGQLQEINERLIRPSMLTSELARTMGLLVVARIAARRGITVQLRSSPGGGTVALVLLPTALLAPPHSAVSRLTVTSGNGDLPDGETLRTRRPGARPVAGASAMTARPPVPAPPSGPTPTDPPPAVLSPVPSTPVPAATFAAAADAPTQAIPAVRQAPPDRPPLLPSGLPQRRPGDLASPGRAATTSSRTDSSGLLDPEAVRARLSGLAGGIAAAHRELAREQRLSAPPATKESTR
ncbi:nitrate- and nitrite sensing domain-containing protein [Catellatospora paridis]|uniref:nitrate- and nitrite sensing domain-containing protein n=1 Tax=Catellatospora paridis TaxID=1617086 RepID=UPI0018AFB6CD|nr:nitrate- and nitrite sensing domain-containing protein [Catellatospora paridis]